MIRVSSSTSLRLPLTPYRYGASARATAANSGSHLSPLAKSFSLLYNSSSLVSVAYSALGAVGMVSRRMTIVKATTGISLTLDNGIDGTTLLTVATIDAFGHIDVVASRPPTTIFSLLGFDRDGQGRTDLDTSP